MSAGTELVTTVGPLLGAQVGESLRLRGRWSSHPKYGRQFEVWSYATVLPATEQGIRRYLGSGLIKGIGAVMATRMVDHFGVDIMHVIDDEPARLIEVAGLGPKRCADHGGVGEQRAIKEVMVFLQGVGVSTSLVVKIYKKYGDESVETVKRELCKLASDIWGIGFKTADTIAASVGIAKDSPERIKAGLAYTLSEAADDGHCYLPEETLIAEGAKILGVLADKVAAQVPDLAAKELAVRDKVPGGQGDGDEVTEAVYRSGVELARARGAQVILTAPTGRAAKRLAELTGREAATIHRLLKLQPGGDPGYDTDNPLDADLVVIDETSMSISSWRTSWSRRSRRALAGDVDQLPSVGAGEVLRDLIGARAVPVVRLTQIFRQARQSGIVVNAHKVNAGRPPRLSGYPDFWSENKTSAGMPLEPAAVCAAGFPALRAGRG